MGKLKIVLPALVFTLSLGVYVFTLNPSLSAADSNEIVTTAIVLGIPHQPSYPVNTILGHLFSKIPFGTYPWRVNLMSSVFQAATVTLVYFVILKLFSLARAAGPAELHPHPTPLVANDFPDGDGSCRSAAPRVSHSANKPGAPAWGSPPRVTPRLTTPYTLNPSYYFLAATAALFLAFSLEFWQFATRAEVFPLNNFWAASLTLILVSFWEKVKGWNQEKLRHPAGGVRWAAHLRGGENQEENVSRKTLQKYSSLTKYLPEEALKRWGSWRTPLSKAPKQGLSLSLKLLYLFALVSGAAFTHHQTIVLLGPAFLFILMACGASLFRRREVLFKLFLCLLLGALPYLLLIPMSRANPPVQWGSPTNLKGVFKALTRSDYGTFSPYAQNPAEIEGTAPKETPITQQLFYLKSLNRDFTFLGIILAILGFYYLARYKRKIFAFLFLGFFFSGPFFLGFANYTLDSGFHQAVAKRFQMLPDLYFTMFLAFGFFFLWEKFTGLKLDFRERKNFWAGFLIILGLTALFLYPLGRNFKDADNRYNNLTFNYARDSLLLTPKNAIILISGDVTTFAFEYWQTLVEKDNDRIIFSPGLLYLDWYVKRLKANHPEIVIPPAKPGHLQASTTEIVNANWGKRPIYLSPELVRYDPKIEEEYVLWPKHLLLLVKQKGDDLKLEPYRAENEALWTSYDLKVFERVRKNNPLLEYAMVPEYARHHFNTGSVFESVHLYDDAIREYNRALEIHPGFPDPYKNLGRVYGFKLKDKDRQKAFEYFQMFLQTALPSQKEDVEAVYGAIGQLQEEAMQEATLSAQPLKASESGKAATPSSGVLP